MHVAAAVSFSLPIAALACSAAAATAQSYQQGDLFLYSPALTSISSSGGGVLRIGTATGTGALVAQFPSTAAIKHAMAFDPYRNALLFMASYPTPAARQLWQCDGDGNAQSLGFAGRSFASMAPVGDGRVYLRDLLDSTPGLIRYLDADNQLRTLLDASGAAPFEFFPGLPTNYEGMVYHAPSNSLFVAWGSSQTSDCGGGGLSSSLVVRRVSLSADGARALAVACTEYDVSASGEVPVGMDLLPDGSVLVVVDTNSNAAEPRMVRIDPTTMVASPWASNGSYVGAAATNAGCYSSVASAVVVLDTFADMLRTFTLGQAGGGGGLPVSATLSWGGSSGEIATLVEYDGTPCSGYFDGYGDGLAGTGGVAPRLSGVGCVLPGATVDLKVSSGLGGGIGLLAFGFAPISVPLFGGTLLAPPEATVTILLQGAPFAAGEGFTTLPLTLPNIPTLTGTSIFAQGAVLDPGALQGISLTPGLQITIG